MYLLILDKKEEYAKPRFHFFNKNLKALIHLRDDCFFETFSEANSLFVKLKKQDINLFVKSRVISTKDILMHTTINQTDAAICELVSQLNKNETK